MCRPTEPADAVAHASRGEWEKSGVWEVSPGVFRIPLPLPGDALRAVNVYAIVAAGELTLIDGGWALEESESALKSALATIGFELGQIRQVIVTHLHRDHYTQAITLRRRTGAHVMAGHGEKKSLREIQAHHDDVISRPLLELLRRNGAHDVAEAIEGSDDVIEPIDPRHWEDPDEWLDDGDTVRLPGRTLRVLGTPGHTHGHIVIHDPAAGLLFTGDHVLPHITPSIGFETVPVDSPLTDFLASLEKLRSLPASRLLPAHGPVLEELHPRLSEQEAHHKKRLGHCQRIVGEGAHTARAVGEQLTWTRREHTFDTLGVFDQMLAVVETAAHLEVLHRRGIFTRTDHTTENHYHLISPA